MTVMLFEDKDSIKCKINTKTQIIVNYQQMNAEKYYKVNN